MKRRDFLKACLALPAAVATGASIRVTSEPRGLTVQDIRDAKEMAGPGIQPFNGVLGTYEGVHLYESRYLPKGEMIMMADGTRIPLYGNSIRDLRDHHREQLAQAFSEKMDREVMRILRG